MRNEAVAVEARYLEGGSRINVIIRVIQNTFPVVWKVGEIELCNQLLRCH